MIVLSRGATRARPRVGRRRSRAAAAPVLALVLGCGGARPPEATAPAPLLTPQQSGTLQRLQAVSVVSERIVWASGTGGAVVRTTDGGDHWQPLVVPGADSLEFRDVEGIDSMTAFLLAAGPGEKSRIYQTTDAGRSWALQFTNRSPEAFFDCFAFWDAKSGIAFSDAVSGTFPIIVTTDGGARWVAVRGPAALPGGEGGFAASGTCVSARERTRAWIATGAGQVARVLYTPDRGAHWTTTEAPVEHGNATSGLTSIAFRDSRHGIAVGGDIGQPDGSGPNVVVSRNGGLSWRRTARTPFRGPAYGVAYTGVGDDVVAVGPRGAAYSSNEAGTWQVLDTLSYWSVDFSNGTGWMVGPAGRVVKVRSKK